MKTNQAQNQHKHTRIHTHRDSAKKGTIDYNILGRGNTSSRSRIYSCPAVRGMRLGGMRVWQPACQSAATAAVEEAATAASNGVRPSAQRFPLVYCAGQQRLHESRRVVRGATATTTTTATIIATTTTVTVYGSRCLCSAVSLLCSVAAHQPMAALAWAAGRRVRICHFQINSTPTTATTTTSKWRQLVLGLLLVRCCWCCCCFKTGRRRRSCIQLLTSATHSYSNSSLSSSSSRSSRSQQQQKQQQQSPQQKSLHSTHTHRHT